jgi:hypothetical protein
MEALLIQMSKALSMDNEFRLQQIVSPLIDGHKKCQIFLFVDSEALVARAEGLTDESQRVAILMQYRRTAPTPVLEASVSI